MFLDYTLADIPDTIIIGTLVMETKKQTILIDVTPIVTPLRYRGIGNQVYSFLKQLEKNHDYHWQFLLPGSKIQFAKAMGYKSVDLLPADWEFFQLPNLPKLEKILPELYYGFFYRRLLRKLKPDLYVNFSGNNYASTEIKTITLIYDLIPYRTNSYSQKSFLANYLKARQYKWLLNQGKQAAKIITISEFSRKDLLELGIPANKIVTIPIAVPTAYTDAVAQLGDALETDQNLKRKVLNIYNLAEPYICYFGGLEKNKNVPAVLSAFAAVSDKYPDLKLVIGGAEFKLGWDHKPVPLNERAEAIYNLARELKILHKVIFTGFVSVEHLPVIYKNALCFIHLSKYEGFGLNPLEVQFLGVPVVAADASTYPEILGKSAILVNPDNIPEIAAALDSLLNNSQESKVIRAELAKAGKENVQRFSWERNYQQTMACFSELLQEIRISEVRTKEFQENLLTNTSTEVSTSNKKVAVILAAYFSPFWGGMEQVALDYARFLLTAGYQVYVITSDRKLGKVVVKKEEEYQGLKIIRLKRSGGNYYFFRLKGITKILRQLQPELIHLHSFGMIAFELALFRYKYLTKHPKLKKITTIATPHGPFMSRNEKGLRLIFKKIYNAWLALILPRLINYVIAVNREQAKWIKNIYHFNDRVIWQFPPVIPAAELTQAELAKIKAKKKYLQITSISRLNEYKGFPEIIAAFQELNSAVATKLFIGGADENATQKIRDLCQYSLRKEDVTFKVNLTEQEKKEILRQTDIFILAGAWEAFGVVLAEAMSEGAAIVSTATEGGRFLVANGHNGYLFEYGNFKQLIEILNKLILDKVSLKKMQAEAYTISKQFFRSKVEKDFVFAIKKNILKVS